MPSLYRADQVGSLLRPPALLESRAAHAGGQSDLETLRAAEDRAILDALALQRDAGIDVYTDGELRRSSWQSDLAEAVDGFVPEHITRPWRGPRGRAEASRAVVARARRR